MKTRYIIILLTALLNFRLVALAQQPPRVPNKEDIVAVVYEFDLTSDGKAHHIKVSQVFRQKDHSDASGALTNAEGAWS